jgi:spermidine/putrescine transport system permease protein
MKQRRWLATLMVPSTLWLVLLFLVPMGTMAIFTFRAGSFGPQRDTFTLEHYRSLLSNMAYHRLLWDSILIAFIVALVSILLAYPVAYFLAFQAGPLRLTLLLVIIVPAWISFLLRVFAWKLILGSGGLLNSFLLSLGLIDEAVPLLLYSRPAVIVALVYAYVPFVALPIFAALQRIDRSLLEAAADLGSSTWQTFLQVTLPLSLPGVMAGFFLTFIPTVGEYVTPLLLGGTQGLMYGNIIQSQFARALNWPLGSLMSFVMLMITLIMMFVFYRLVRLDDLVEG